MPTKIASSDHSGSDPTSRLPITGTRIELSVSATELTIGTSSNSPNPPSKPLNRNSTIWATTRPRSSAQAVDTSIAMSLRADVAELRRLDGPDAVMARERTRRIRSGFVCSSR